MGELKSKVVKGALWQMSERMFCQVASFLVTLVLSRLLTPSDYGTIALLTIFIGVSSSLVDCGMGLALVQKKDATELHFNSLFYATLGLASAVYAILFLVAPYIARFYHMPSLTWLMRVISLTLVFGAINSVQNAALLRGMLFHLSFRISVIITMTSMIVGITAAIFKMGPWALVLQSVSSGFVGVIARWFIISWRPKLMFSFGAVKELFDFGWKLSITFLIANVAENMYGLIIGKRYSKEDLAYVNKGGSLPGILMTSISGTIIGVSFPALSKMQDSNEAIRTAMKRMLQCAAFVVFPLMAGLAVCAHDVIILFFGRQWLPAVIFMQLFCLQRALTTLCDINVQGIAAIGRTGWLVPMQILKSGSSFIVLCAALKFGLVYFVILQCFVCKIFEWYVNAWPNKQLFNFSFWQQIKVLMPMAFNAFVMTIVVGAMRYFAVSVGLCEDSVVQLFCRVLLCGVTGCIVYFVTSAALRVDALYEYLRIILPWLDNKVPSMSVILRRASRCGR